MSKIIVKKSPSLKGTVRISGSKNSTLPIIAASLLTDKCCILKDVPKLMDVEVICQVLASLGVKVKWLSNDSLEINSALLLKSEAPYELMRKMRASFLILGPLLARKGKARVSLPGGCAIGSRPIDLHLKGLKALGANITLGHGYIDAKADKLVGSRIYMDFPSVGATENVMMAASLAQGETIIENAAQEPEIVDLANYLSNMGAKINGAGTNTIRINGVSELKGCTHTIIPDRIEAGTYMVAAAITNGDVIIQNVLTSHIKPIIAKLREADVKVIEGTDEVRVIGNNPIKAVDVKTLPYPGFPTDMQAQFMALMGVAKGTSVIVETVFENRFMHVNELRRMGAAIKIDGRSAIIEGTKELTGAPVKATDLRAGVALIIAGLVSSESTEITDIYHIDRGYVNIEQKLSNLGANIFRV
ncbi:UDP-N-acetylglucosamine 1-carboxyvinyltransferase [Abyssisolibacter fermentans]|uniref:UDP-N-acetylglucosamine 1-carboxyvinyltransferase n=1 Tax=Abyssisolibacter fermentans TaxID=1766203 RepID=UPI00082CCECA|nr:UDP-N-acetylglucosamine 1-carboxyvinyltransferase [Abyssisolibacter fermentans]